MGKKLKSKIPVAFSLDFEYVQTKGDKLNTPEKMNAPLDVKISYRNEIILVSDSVNGRIMVFDLNSGLYKSDFFTELAPWQFVLEENYDGEKNEALICSTGNNYLKYDLLQLLKSDRSRRATPIWKTKFERFSCFQCCAIKYETSGNTLYCCNSATDTIVVYSCANGSVVKKITQAVSFEIPNDPINYSFARPVGIDYNFNSGAHEFVLAMMGESVFYIRESPDGTWVVRNELETTVVQDGSEKTILDMPCAALIDRNNHNVIICSYGTSSMAVFNKEGTFIKSFGARGRNENNRFMDQTSCCLNEITGELLIVDSHNNRVQIYK